MMQSDIQQLADTLKNISEDIAIYLATQQAKDGTFPARDFYGRSFAALLWSNYGDRFRTNINRAVNTVNAEKKVRKGPGKYHFEFNRFALSKMGIKKEELNTILQGERYAGTRVANWILLRACCRLTTGNVFSRIFGQFELMAVILLFRSKDGLIEDEKGSFTSQYHMFCVALLGEAEKHVWSIGRSAIRKTILEGADVIAQLTLPGGQCNYIGRGRLQSFGYAAAILALVHAFRISGDRKYLYLMANIANYLLVHQKENGSIPLVLSELGREEGRPDEVDQTSPHFAGWYTYNNYFDYLPFTGALLELARDGLQSAQHKTRIASGNKVADKEFSEVQVSSLGPDIIIITTELYTAVVSTPNQIWASSQPMPYLATKNSYPLPCYGGEQDGNGLYSVADLPLPCFRARGADNVETEYNCDPASYHWKDSNTMLGRWQHGGHQRTFAWREASYEVTDLVTFEDKKSASPSVQCTIIRLPLPEQIVTELSGSLLVVPLLKMTAEHDWEKMNQQVYGPDGPMQIYGNTVTLPKGGEISAKHVVHVSRI